MDIHNAIMQAVKEQCAETGVPVTVQGEPVAESADDWGAFTVLAFDDDTISVQPIHRGTLESCQKVAQMIAALSYNGDKKVVESAVALKPWSQWEEFCKTGKVPGQ